MKRFFLILVLFPIAAFGQAVRVDIPLLTSGPNIPTAGGPFPQALWLSNATIQICTHPATLSSCTYATTYIDGTATTQCPPTQQIVNLPGNTCSASSGIVGNIGFWYGGGTVDYIVTSTYGTYGPYTVTGLNGGGNFISSIISAKQTMIGPLQLTGTGTYSGSVSNSALSATMDSCDPTAVQTLLGVGTSYSASLGCVNVPSGSSILQANGVTGIALDNPGGSATNAVALYGVSIVNSGNGWGANTVATDVNPSGGGVFLTGYEDDINIVNVNTIAVGLDIIGAWKANPALSHAIDINEPLSSSGGPYEWGIGIDFPTRATDTAINFNPQNAGNNTPSQKMTWVSIDGSSVQHLNDLWEDATGGMLFTMGGANTVRLGPDGAVSNIFSGGGNQILFHGLEPGLSSSSYVGTEVGAADTPNDNAVFAFQNIGGTGSTSNAAVMGSPGNTLNVDMNGNVSIDGATNIVYRCVTDGASTKAGVLTITAADCGSSADTGLRVK